MATSSGGMTFARELAVGCEFVYVAEIDTPAVFQIRPQSSPTATVRQEWWTTTPELPRRDYTDLFGNGCTRVTLPVGETSVRYDARVGIADATEDVDLDAAEMDAADLPDDVLLFTLPSRYVLPDVLGDVAWSLFAELPRGYRRVAAICDYVHGHLTFSYGTSTPLTTAADVYAAGTGVCRDFTHLAITFCRALSIPARYVFGYLPQIDVQPLDAPMDFAAWMEVYLDDRWWTFDPRNNAPRKGRVLIGRGRDALDVAMSTTFGGPLLTRMDVRAEEVPA